MKKKVYVETSIVSFLGGRPSRNLLAAAWQSITTDWWENRREFWAHPPNYPSPAQPNRFGRGGQEFSQ